MVLEYFEPTTSREALDLLGKHGDDARVIAGGQSLLVMIRQRFLSPSYLISLKKVSGLQGVTEDPSGKLVIGAMTTHKEVSSSPVLSRKVPILCQAGGKVGSTAIRNMGTIGGNICHNEMGADPPTALLALDAKAVCESAKGRRAVPLEVFFKDFFETALQRGEILTALEVPAPPADAVGVYLKHVLRTGDLAIVGAAVLLELESEGKKCREVRIGLGGVSPIPLRARKAEAILRGNEISDAILNEVGEVAMSEADPISDAHGTAEYRRRMVAVFVKRAIRQALDLASKKGKK